MQAFYGAEPAKAHQKELTGKTDGLHKVSNGNYVETAEAIVEDIVTADEVSAEGADGVKGKKSKKEPA